MYSRNAPTNMLDPDGDSVVVLFDSEGALGFGHMAILVGNEKDGWELFSKNGTDDGKGVGPFADAQVGRSSKDFYGTLADFGKDSDDQQTRYDKAIMIETTYIQDGKMKEVAKEEALKDYDKVKSNCAGMVVEALEAGGVKARSSRGDDWNPERVFLRIWSTVTNNAQVLPKVVPIVPSASYHPNVMSPTQ